MNKDDLATRLEDLLRQLDSREPVIASSGLLFSSWPPLPPECDSEAQCRAEPRSNSFFCKGPGTLQ